MMTSSNGNIFRVTGPFCGEFTGHRWIPRTMFSLISAWINGWVNNREASDLRRHRAHYNVTVMYDLCSLLSGMCIMMDLSITPCVTQFGTPEIASITVQYVTVLRRAKHNSWIILLLGPHIPRKFGQYHGCWCHGPLLRQTVSSNVIKCTG